MVYFDIVVAKNLPNVAKYKNATQISTHHNDESIHGAHFVTDGQVYPNAAYGMRCSTTTWETSPWLVVDLEDVYVVDYVVIFNRKDDNGQ